MANVLPRLFYQNTRRVLQFSKYRFYPISYSTIRINSFSKYQLLLRNEKLLWNEKYRSTSLLRTFSDERTKDNLSKEPESSKPTLFQRFKSMYKDYWYVLIPVHVVTSIGWFGGFYYMARSGVDIVGFLEAMNVSEKIVDSMRDSHMGYFAIAYACYKIATPARYTITLGGTTLSINYLKKWGYIKPVPSAEKLKEMYKETKDNFDRTMKEKKDDLIAKKVELKTKFDNRLEQGIHKIEELKNKTENMKSRTEEVWKKKK